MQKPQLYIDGQRVDMFEEVNITITDTLKNVKDVSKVFTEFSQTFSLPASKTNNKIFKHYYNSDIQNGFDARIRATAKIELNSIPYKEGYIKLEGVDLRNNNPHTYRITFFGNTVSLKNLLGDDLLSSLGSVPVGKINFLDEFSKKDDGTYLKYEEGDIETYLTSEVYRTIDGVTYQSPIQIPLVTHTQRLTYDSHSSSNDVDNIHYSSGYDHGVKFNELKYALKLSVLIKAIEEKYGLSFSSDFFNNSGNDAFNNLYMWLHRKKGGVKDLGDLNESLIDGFSDGSDTNTYSTMSNNSVILSYVPQPNELANPLGYTALFVETTTLSTNLYRVSIRKNGIEVENSGDITTGQKFTTSVNFNQIEKDSSYTAHIESDSNLFFGVIDFKVFHYTPAASYTKTYSISNYTYTSSFNFVITQQIPKMKVLDFLTSIFKMFNLVAYVEGGIMVVKTLDTFYANPSTDSPYDITKYIDVNSSKVDSALPFREVDFSYKGLKTFLAKKHEQLFSEDWGTEEYNGEDSSILSNSIFKVEVPFEHMKFERLIDSNTSILTDVQYGYCVDDNQQSYIGQPLIFYMDLKALPTTPVNQRISFVYAVGPNNNPTLHRPISSYYTPANSDLSQAQVEDRQSIHFSPENDEWELTTTNETLFNNYHRNYISSVFNASNRLTKATAYLPLRILLKYTLADRFVVAGKSYKINSIETDFYTGKSEIELLSDI